MAANKTNPAIIRGLVKNLLIYQIWGKNNPFSFDEANFEIGRNYPQIGVDAYLIRCYIGGIGRKKDQNFIKETRGEITMNSNKYDSIPRMFGAPISDGHLLLCACGPNVIAKRRTA